MVEKFKDQNKSDRLAPTGQTELHRPRRLRPSGGYRQLRSFQTATLIYDGTVSFCDRFINPHSRTHDQMVQAARSGRQNIAEGSRAGATSSKSETYLTNVARASLDELLLDFEDFIRQRKLIQWAKNDTEALAVRRAGRRCPWGRQCGDGMGPDERHHVVQDHLSGSCRPRPDQRLQVCFLPCLISLPTYSSYSLLIIPLCRKAAA